MDKRAAEQYLRQIYGTQQGYVAVGYKDRDNTWHEDQFAWPSEKAKLLAWAERDSNIFICPTLRRNAHTRKKGDMLPTRWLWADVDWQTVPADKLEEVNRRIAELGGVTVLSGSGDNVHVYVELSRQVDASEHAKLNTGLRDYLYADNKQADNSLLRLPGTTNWKTDQGSPVQWQKKTSRAMSPDALLKRRVFRDAKVPPEVEAAEWDFVPMDGVSKRVMRLVQMPVDESLGRYGKRHKAVWAVTKQLTRWGYGPDEVHSLMHTFPPALDKMAEENGYDPHLDIDRCLAAVRATEKLTEAQQSDIEEDVFELADEADDLTEFEERVRRLAQAELERSEARKRARILEAERSWVPPPDHTSQTLSDALRVPPAPQQYLIDGLVSAQGRVVIVGQYKTGKTYLMVCSLLTALADDEPFLGVYDVHVPEGGAVVGHWNLEMSELDLVDKYMRPAEFKNPGNVHLAHWQGYRVGLLTEPGQAAAIAWLKDREAKVWTIDSWSALCRSSGVDPNDGKDVGMLMSAIDEIKREAGIDAVFMLAHIARASSDSDKPGTKGSSVVDEAVDTRWMFTVDKSDVRYLSAEGRGTQMSAISLDFDETTGRSKLGSTTRQTAAMDGWVQVIIRILKNHGGRGMSSTTLVKLMKETKPIGVRMAKDAIVEAIEAGHVIVREESAGHGGRPSKMHYLTDDNAPDGDRMRRATPREVNLSNVRMRKR
jgi:hypothetical protein